jgi:hypothetical protein
LRKRRNVIMKNVFLRKAVLFIFVVIAAFVAAAPICDAWQVQVTNDCNKPVKIYVRGEHFLVKQIDWEGWVLPGKTVTCTMPGAICPVSIAGLYQIGEEFFDMPETYCFGQVACCWNSRARVVQKTKLQCELKFE